MSNKKLDYIEITVKAKEDLTWNERKQLIEKYQKQGFTFENQCKNTYYFVRFYNE